MTPLPLRTAAILSCKIVTRLVPVKATATEAYQPASIAAAVIPIIAVSFQLESERTRWLNIARKNKATFGLRSEIKNPSLAPLIANIGLVDPGSIRCTERLPPATIVRNPI